MKGRFDSSQTACEQPVESDVLMDYWLAALDAEAETSVEEHLFACDACGDRLRHTIAVAEALRDIARSGSLRLVVSEAFLRRAEADRRQVRAYSPPPGGSIQCTISEDDDFLVARLAADLTGAPRVDLVLSDAQGHERQRLSDIPVRRDAGAVLYHESAAFAKRAPDDVMRLRLVAVDADGGERLLGEYEMRHTRTIPGPPAW